MAKCDLGARTSVLYQEDDNIGLREAAADAYGLSKDHVISGNGSSELLALIYRAFLGPGDSVAIMSPGFSFNRKLALLQSAKLLEVSWSDSHSIPIDQLLLGPAKDAKFILLANPNNPTGTFVSIADIERLVAQSDRLIVLDEAYVDFAPDNGLRLVRRYPNLLLLRTFVSDCPDDRRMPVIGDDLTLRPTAPARNSACTLDHDQFSLASLIDAPTVYLKTCCALPPTSRVPLPCIMEAHLETPPGSASTHVSRFTGRRIFRSTLLGGFAPRISHDE